MYLRYDEPERKFKLGHCLDTAKKIHIFFVVTTNTDLHVKWYLLFSTVIL